MRAITAVALAVSVTVVLAGCSGSPFSPAVPEGDPDIRGVITAIEFGDGGTASARVVWTNDPVVGTQAGFDAAQVAVVEETDVFKRVGDADEPVSETELNVGSVVEAWFTGPVAESYPVQATADAVVIIGRYKGELPVPPGLEP